MSLEYHQRELEIALDPSHPAHILPPPLSGSERALDIGCGAGATLIGAYPDRVCFGLDPDFEALALGKKWTENIRFVCGAAEALPYGDRQFDMVVARVSLPYTNIPSALLEIRRVLKPGGRLWMTLHPLSIPWRQALSANLKGKLHFLYVLFNGLLFHCFQKLIPFLNGRYESFQTSRAITVALEKAGFTVDSVACGAHLLVCASVKDSTGSG